MIIINETYLSPVSIHKQLQLPEHSDRLLLLTVDLCNVKVEFLKGPFNVAHGLPTLVEASERLQLDLHDGARLLEPGPVLLELLDRLTHVLDVLLVAALRLFPLQLEVLQHLLLPRVLLLHEGAQSRRLPLELRLQGGEARLVLEEE